MSIAIKRNANGRLIKATDLLSLSASTGALGADGTTYLKLKRGKPSATHALALRLSITVISCLLHRLSKGSLTLGCKMMNPHLLLIGCQAQKKISHLSLEIAKTSSLTKI